MATTTSIGLLLAITQTDVSIEDTFTSVEEVGLQAQIGVTDLAEGTDNISLLALIPVSDTSTSEETLAILNMLGVVESGTATEEIAIINFLSIDDAGLGLRHTGIFTPLGVLAAVTTDYEDEQIDIKQLVVLSDDGSGLDGVSILALLSLLDSGSGVDSSVQIFAFLQLVETINYIETVFAFSQQTRGKIVPMTSKENKTALVTKGSNIL